MTEGDQQIVKKKNRQRGKNRRIGFSEEIVTKDLAETLLVQESHGKSSVDKNTTDQDINGAKQKKKLKRNKTKGTEEFKTISQNDQDEKCDNQDNTENAPKKKRKKNKSNKSEDTIMSSQDENERYTVPEKKPKKNKDATESSQDDDETVTPKKKRKMDKPSEVTDESEPKVEESKESKSDGSTSLSKRALKKIKYQKLLDDKKTMVNKAMQQKVLTYLSNWKHNKQNWKFEKLKQIWILQNLYDPTRIEEKFWDITVEYFSNSTGKVHKKILEEAIKIAESESDSSEENVKLKRARDLIQNLQD